MSEKGQEHILIIPDYKISIVTSFLEMIYTGNTCVETDKDFEEMKQFGFKLLGFFIGLNMNVQLEKKIVRRKPVDKTSQIESDKQLSKGSALQLSKKTESVMDNLDESFCEIDHFPSTDDNSTMPRSYLRRGSRPQSSSSWIPIESHANETDQNLTIKSIFPADNGNDAVFENYNFTPTITKLHNNQSKRSKLLPCTTISHLERIRTTEFNNHSKDSTDSMGETSSEDSNNIFHDNFEDVDRANKIENIDTDLSSSSHDQEVSKKMLNQREWKCTDCLEKLPTKKELMRHSLQIHNETNPFPCNVCPKRYTTEAHLRAHHKITHLKIKNIVCQKCGRKFGCNSDFNKHMKRSCDS